MAYSFSLIVLYCLAFLFDITLFHEIQQREKRAAVDGDIQEALDLFYYPQKFNGFDELLVKTRVGTFLCDYSEIKGGFYLNDILGEARGNKTLRECLWACRNHDDCLAMNYCQSDSRCILLRSGTTNNAQTLKNTKWTHLLFNDCITKFKNVPTKLLDGNSSVSCGIPNFESSIFKGAPSKIVGGTEAMPYSWPWIGYLWYTDGQFSDFLCGCVLILNSKNSDTQTNVALTAGHCVRDGLFKLNPKTIKLYFGSHDLRFTEAHEYVVNVSDITVHNSFTGAFAGNDIAVLKFQTNVTFSNFIRPICLPTFEKIPNNPENCVAIGWGLTKGYSDMYPNRLRQVKSKINSNAVCKSSSAKFDSNTMVCAGVLDGTSDTCNGDSGGPLICFEDNRWVLYGLTSFGSGNCSTKNYPGMYTKVSAYTKTFIPEAIGN